MSRTPLPFSPRMATALWDVLGRRSSLCLRGRSMWPALRPGDDLVLEAAPATIPPRLGDVVVYWQDDRWVAHRTVWFLGRGVGRRPLFKGDAQRRFDPPCRGGRAILGRVIGKRLRDDRIRPLLLGSRSLAIGIALISLLEGLVVAAVDRCLTYGMGPNNRRDRFEL